MKFRNYNLQIKWQYKVKKKEKKKKRIGQVENLGLKRMEYHS